MKKKLYQIFDEATPHELDQLSKELKALELQEQVLSSVKNNVYTKIKLADCNKEKGRIITMTKSKKITAIIKGISAGAACLAIMIGCIAGYSALFKQAPAENQAVATTITLDVNPSLEIKANKDERVLEVVALNKDAEIIIGDKEFEGNSLELTVNTLICSMVENGYINQTANSVLLSVDSGDENNGNAIKDKLSAEISNLFHAENIDGSVIGQTVSSDDTELSALAAQYGITLGKAKLIQTVMTINSDGDFSRYAELSITELNRIMTESADKPKDENIYIGEEKALEIALKELNVMLDDLSSEPTIELISSRGDICYFIKVSITKYCEDIELMAVRGVYVNAFTGKLSGKEVTSPNFSMEEAWDFVCQQLGSEAEGANLYEQQFNDMESGLPMTYTFNFEIGGIDYTALVDAMNGIVIRIVKV